MTIRDKLIIYIYHKTNKIENEKKELNSTRYRTNMDSLDMYELMRADIRLQCWDEFVNEIFDIIINCK